MVSPLLIPIVSVIAVPVIVIGLPLARAIASRIEHKPGSSTGIPADLNARIERMEQSIDVIAVEIERISEGQRFTTKLLSERVAPLDSPDRR